MPSLIELDLLRGGSRILPDLGLEAMIEQIETARRAYLVLVNRAWRRAAGASLAYSVYPIGLREPLPCIAGAAERGRGRGPARLAVCLRPGL